MIKNAQPIEARVGDLSIYLFEIWMTRKGLSHAKRKHLKRTYGVAAGIKALRNLPVEFDAPILAARQ
ncbi:hypothetical protein DSLASN_48240 [Desulfoluna limicola]|uniref:Uncharacterized protein n=1 Tax=Desulfoluna limicola TaxID=2810562 RepID=A0ABM7PPD4_9BACT|nr:hypothetical protein DSLASN_48240 [Desulfoluna limicola]